MMAATAIVPSRTRIEAPDIDAPEIGTTELESWSESARGRTRSGWTDTRAALLIRPTMPVPPSGAMNVDGPKVAPSNPRLRHGPGRRSLTAVTPSSGEAAGRAMQRRSAIRSRGAEPSSRRLGTPPKAVTPAPPTWWSAPPTSWRTAGATRQARPSPRPPPSPRAPAFLLRRRSP
jgi:hypothetical protein